MRDLDDSAAGPFLAMPIADPPSLPGQRLSREELVVIDEGRQVLAALLQGPAGARPEDVKDAVQEALLAWLRKPLTGLEPLQLRSWLRTAAERHLWKSADPVLPPAGVPEDGAFVDSAGWMEDRVLLREILDRHAEAILTGRSRNALARWAHGHSAQDIARDGSMTIDTVRQKIRRGLLKLRDLFRPKDSTPF